MTFAGYNVLAIALAALAGFITGAVWYGLLAKPWIRAAGIKDVSNKPPLGAMVLAAVANLVMAVMLAGVIGHLGPGAEQVTLRNGIVSALFIWVGFIVTTQTVNYTFQRRRRMLSVIDGGHWLLVLVVQGALIGVMGV
ncbi:MAG: DUF1761 domain-containing protein [Hyphomicrobiales bacterium]|nr:MAG: DUF1761 domain-containing protein [Hyphomicrobiales bacterium]